MCIRDRREGLAQGDILEVDAVVALPQGHLLDREGPQARNGAQTTGRYLDQALTGALHPGGIRREMGEVVRPGCAPLGLGLLHLGPHDAHAGAVLQGTLDGFLQGQAPGRGRLCRKRGRGKQEEAQH